MKLTLITTALVALTASALQAQYAPGLSQTERQKPWTISASLRGFYDDNYLTIPSGPSTYGLEVSPSLLYQHSAEQTSFSAKYIYDLKYYENKSITDQSHKLDLVLDHKFSELSKLRFNDSFVVAQEPEALAGAGPTATPLRTVGSNIRNTAAVDYTLPLSRQFAMDFSYANTIYRYEQDITKVNPAIGEVSRAGLLDRMEHQLSGVLRWHVLPETTAMLGYQFVAKRHSADEPIAYDTTFTPRLRSFNRDNDTHRVFVGVDQNFSEELQASLRVGADYVDYYRLPGGSKSRISPYADGSVTYTYLPGSYVQGGVRHQHYDTDVIGSFADPVLDQEATVVYAQATHKFPGDLTGSVVAQYQRTDFNGGGVGVSGNGEDYITAGLNLSYKFSPNLSAETGYNYDRLFSDVGRGFTRNRIYVGVRATF